VRRALLLAVVVVHADAWADCVTERQPHTSRLSLTYGASWRSSDQSDGIEEKFHGVSPSLLHLNGAYFFKRWLGVSLDASAEWFWISGHPIGAPNQTVQTGMFDFRVLPELVLRWSPRPGTFNLEGLVGWGGGTWPTYEPNGATVSGSSIGYTGPTFGALMAIEPRGWAGGLLFFRVAPFNFASHDQVAGLHLSWASLGAQLHFGDLQLGELHAAVTVEGELTGAAAGNGNTFAFNQTQGRFALGLRFRGEPEPVQLPCNAGSEDDKGTLRGSVVFEGHGVPNANLDINVGEASAQTDASGNFELKVRPGRARVVASAVTFKAAAQDVEVPARGEAHVTLTLTRPTGPGTIKGLVKGDAKADKPDAPIEGAEVAAEGASAVKTAADGTFTVEKAGPGPVKVTVKAKGFAGGEEIVQVPPEASAEVTFALAKQGERAPATIRGLIVRASDGKPIKAAVRISELNLKVQVKPDGRFVAQVPGGKYTLIIDAPGFVSQTKNVEVADGDQAIFHCELQTSR
jgi:hypothetical protein